MKTAEDIKGANPLARVMREYGVEVPFREGRFPIKCCFHEDSDPSMTIDTAEGWFKCHGCGAKGDVISFVALKENCTNGQAMARMGGTEPAASAAKNGNGHAVIASYSYRDESGVELFVKRRMGNKDFIQGVMRNGSFTAGIKGVRRVLYRLPEILKARQPIWITEGEKDADNLSACGFPATTNPEGGGKWDDSYNDSLRGRDLIFCGDNDDIGRKHIVLLFKQLSAAARTIRHVTIPAPHKDASDLISACPTKPEAATRLFDLAEKSRVVVDNTLNTLPDIVSAADLVESDLPMPLELVSGLLHQGTKFALGGGSKTCKTWVLLHLAIAISAGVPFFDRPTIQSRVLFVNLEIHPAFFRRRIARICKELEIEVPPFLDIWNLRGYEADSLVLLPKITDRIKEKGYGTIILDPIYKTYGDLKENAAEDMTKLLNHFERVAFQSNAAIGFAAHFSKGNQASKDTIDRISGSGVFARDPDSIMTMTSLEKEGTFVFEASLRNLKPFKPFGIKWHYPVMIRDDDIDPTKLKKPGGKPKGYEESKVGGSAGQRHAHDRGMAKNCLH